MIFQGLFSLVRWPHRQLEFFTYLPEFNKGAFSNGSSTSSLFETDGASTLSGDKSTLARTSDCDWATFITAYAVGRWDPHRTPNPPRSCQQIMADSFRFMGYEPSKAKDFEIPVETFTREALPVPSASPESNLTTSTKIDERSPLIPPPPPSLAGPTISSTASIITRPAPSLRLPLPTHRFRNSFSSITSNPTSNQTPSSGSDIRATVATMRWAAARVDISPLALPSPEHELTDPMRGVTATIPGSHSQDLGSPIEYVATPGGTRRSRLNVFWEGTTDVDAQGSPQQDPIAQSATILGSSSDPVITNNAVASHREGTESSHNIEANDEREYEKLGFASQAKPMAYLPPLASASAPPASAPSLTAYHSKPMVTTDYFGELKGASPPSLPKAEKISPAPSLPKQQIPLPPVLLRNDNSLPILEATSVPALPRRLCLTRQTSSPLPESTPQVPRHLGVRAPAETITSVKLGRAAKEERMFVELEYLAPPYPPYELERRRALYKFVDFVHLFRGYSVTEPNSFHALPLN